MAASEIFRNHLAPLWLKPFVSFVLVCSCPNRDSGDFLCVFLFVVLTAAVSSNFLQSMGADDRLKGDGWQKHKKRRWTAGQVRMGECAGKVLVHHAHWAKETESRELREENKRLTKEGRTSSVQSEDTGEEGRFAEDGKMEVDRKKVDSKRKSDLRKKEVLKQRKSCSNNCETSMNAAGCAGYAQRTVAAGDAIY